MKQTINTFFLFLVIVSHVSFGQTGLDTLKKKTPNVLIFAPINLFDIINPSFQIGYERAFTNKISMQIEGGPIMKRSLIGYFFTTVGSLRSKDSWWTNSGFKLRSEVKYYFKKYRNYTLNPYLSGEIFYTRNITNITVMFEVSDPTYDYSTKSKSYLDSYTLNKQRIGFNLKVGVQFIPDNSKHFLFESHLGIGIVYRTSTQQGRANPNDKFYNESFLNLMNKENEMWLLNLPFNFKIGYRF